MPKHMTKDKDRENNILEIDVPIYADAPCATRQEHIYVPLQIWAQWKALCNQMGEMEWAGVFDVDSDGKVTNFRVPRQIVTPLTFEFLEDIGGDGVIHSHHKLGAFHSSTDDKSVSNLFTYSIVISQDNCDARKRVTLKCGALGYARLNVIIGYPDVTSYLSRIVCQLPQLSERDLK